MEQFNSNNYKKRTALQEFRHSCLGRIIMLLAIFCVLFLIAFLTRPSDNMMRWQTEDNIKECLLASDSIQSDAIDDYVENLGRVFTHADTTQVDPETWETFTKYNQLAIYSHTCFKTAYIHNNTNPSGVRVGVGIFGIVFPTIKFTDLLLNTGKVRGDYGEQLIHPTPAPELNMGETPNIQPFHYQGNPDN